MVAHTNDDKHVSGSTLMAAWSLVLLLHKHRHPHTQATTTTTSNKNTQGIQHHYTTLPQRQSRGQKHT